MTYAELKQAIEDYVQSTETTFVSHLDDFIQQSEIRLWQTLQTPDTRQLKTGTISGGDSTIAPVIGIIEVNGFGVSAASDLTNSISYLLPKDETWIREAYPSASTQGQPRFYALKSVSVNGSEVQTSTLIFAPSADASYNYTLLYYGMPESIVTAGTSWYGTFATDALLYQCLVEAYGFLKGEQDMLNFYKAKADEAIGRLQRMSEGLQRGDAYRNGEIRRPVQ